MTTPDYRSLAEEALALHAAMKRDDGSSSDWSACQDHAFAHYATLARRVIELEDENAKMRATLQGKIPIDLGCGVMGYVNQYDAVAAEREACAEIAEVALPTWETSYTGMMRLAEDDGVTMISRQIARAIRARGQP